MLELVLELVETVGALLNQRHLVSELDEGAGEVGAHFAPACDQGVHPYAGAFSRAATERTASVRTEIAVEVGHTVRRPSVA